MIRQNGYAPPDKKGAAELLYAMLQHIGDTDAYIRDDLIYSTFCEWICEKDIFETKTIRDALTVLMDDKHLFFKIGSVGDTSVFTRSFSMLAIVQILCLNRKKNLLDTNQFEQTKAGLLRYLIAEKDFRGYTAVYGWAHAAAHGADVLEELARHKDCNECDVEAMLACMQKIFCNGRYLLSHEEDERMASAAVLLFKRNPAIASQVAAWIEGLPCFYDVPAFPQKYIARVNTKNFVRSVYFRCLHAGEAVELQKALLNVEKRLNRFA